MMPSADATFGAAPLIGFRSWWLKHGCLNSLGWQERWDEAIQHAVCRPPDPEFTEPPPSHEAPRLDCECGIYALHAPDVAGRHHGNVWGIVALWGRIVVHRRGVRAQHACIKALAAADRSQTMAVRRIAKEMGVDTVAVAELAEAAVRYGTMIPSELLPVVGKPGYRDLSLLRTLEVAPPPVELGMAAGDELARK